MKKTILTIALFISTLGGFAQNGFNYKALITENGTVLANQSVNVRFTVLENGNTEVYRETHTATTDQNGILIVNIGEGTVENGDFATINWENEPYLKVEIDSGNGYTDFGTTAFRYVPLAKYADKAGNVFSGDYNDLTNKPETFLKVGSNELPDDVFDNVYHLGQIYLGTSTNDSDKAYLYIKRHGNYDYWGTINIVNNIKNMGAMSSIIGLYNDMENTGDGSIFGVQNSLSGTGYGFRYGVYNWEHGSGNGRRYGTYSWLEGSGDGEHFGTYNILEGDGTGDKYGTYNKINPSAGGTHYAVYGEATKTDSYAGYFVGDVYASQKLKAPASGNADMKAYIYGWIMAPGSINISASSSGFSAEKESTGVYKITFSESNITSGQYIVIVTKQGTSVPRFVSASNYDGYFKVYIRDQSGNFTDGGFQFVVYKK